MPQDEARHALRVLRLRVGDRVELFDGEGRNAAGPIVTASRSQVQVRVEEVRQSSRPQPQVVIATALPKGSRAADMVNQLSQLGADEVVPLHTQRSMREPGEHATQRLQRSALESAKQCRRDFVLRVGEARTIESLLALAPPTEKALALITCPRPDALPWPALMERVSHATNVLALIGPEGGFTDEEQADARRHGALPWRLGPHILRIETAATAAAALLRGGTDGK